MRILLCEPNGNSDPQLELPIELDKSIFHHTRVHAQGLSSKWPGVYKFLVELKVDGIDDWKHMASIPFVIRFKPRNKQSNKASDASAQE